MTVRKLNVFSEQSKRVISKAFSKLVSSVNEDYFGKQLLKLDCTFNEAIFSSLTLPNENVFDTQGRELKPEEPKFSEQLLNCLLGTEADMLEQTLKQAMLHTWKVNFFKHIDSAFVCPTQEQWAVCVTIKTDFEWFHIALTEEQLRPYLNHEQSMTFGNVLESVKSKNIDVNVTMTSQPLTFEDLINLRPGMVLPLQQRLDKPLAVKLNKHVCAGFLVQSGQMKSIYLDS